MMYVIYDECGLDCDMLFIWRHTELSFGPDN